MLTPQGDGLAPTCPAAQPADASGATAPGPWVRLAVYVVLIAITVAAYAPTVRNGFVSYDDDHYLYANPGVQQGFIPEAVRWAFITAWSNNYHPLTWLSHMLDVSLFGLAPGPHHAVSLGLHVATSVLLLAVLHALTRAFWASALVAALFALHPVNVEPVAWISGRKHVLSTFFWVLAIGAYGWYARRPGALSYGATLLAFTLGVLSKNMVLTLPCVLLLLDAWPLRRLAQGATVRLLVLEKVPLFVVCAATAGVNYIAQRVDTVPPPSLAALMISLDAIPLGDRVLNMPVHYAVHLTKAVWPTDLAVIYPHPGAFPRWQSALALLLLLGATGLAVRHARRAPYVLVGWLWFLGTLVPVIGLVQTGRSSTCDRYGYVPLIGVFIAVAFGAAQVIARWPRARAPLTVLALISLGAFAIVTRAQVTRWKDSVALYRQAISAHPGNHMAHQELAVAYEEAGALDDAERHFREVVRLVPDYHSAWCGLGRLEDRRGRTAEAVKLYEHALRIMPFAVKYRILLGIAYEKLGRRQDAVRQFRQALTIKPLNSEAHQHLGLALSNDGEHEAALVHFQQAKASDPEDFDTLTNLGVCLARLGRLKEAQLELGAAVRLYPGVAMAHHNYGLILAALDQPDAAMRHYGDALRLDPTMADTHFRLGTLLMERGRVEEAVRHLSESVRLRPDFAPAQVAVQRARAVLEARRRQ